RPRDVLRACGHGRPDRDLLAPERAEPPRGRADRPRPLAGGGASRDRPGRRGPDDGARAARPRAPVRDRDAHHRGRLRGARRAAAGGARRRADGSGADRRVVGYRAAMRARTFSFTSESVTEGHPDKVADQVSDSVLDAVLGDDPPGRVACETLVTTGLVV